MKTPHARAVESETGEFTITQNGVVVAAGTGPVESIRDEACHYAMMYLQDGPLTMRVWNNQTTPCPHCSGSRILHGCGKESCDCDNAGGYGCAPVACGECGEP